jgi:hypothetical protein
MMNLKKLLPVLFNGLQIKNGCCGTPTKAQAADLRQAEYAYFK